MKLLKKLLNPFWPLVRRIILKILSLKKLTIIAKTETINEYRSQIFSSRKIQNIVDCGSGSGDYGSLISNINSNCIIHCIEAYDLSIEQLKIRFKNNNNFHFHNLGLWGKNTEKELNIYGFPETNSFFRMNDQIISQAKEIEKMAVSCTTINSFAMDNSIKEIFLLHIDVNGSEYQILSGATDLLSKKAIKNIEMDIILPSVYSEADNVSSCIALLNDYDYILDRSFIEVLSYQYNKHTFFLN